MAVKRHAISGTLNQKVRHIYDVAQLYKLDDIRSFLADKDRLKEIVEITKKTDSLYLHKRDSLKKYNPSEQYNFLEWKHKLGNEIKRRYETLHNDLLYTDQK